MQLVHLTLDDLVLQASKIPPIHERQTASNISFAKGGELNEKEKCSPLVKESSASHGVRLRLSDSPSITTDTIPLLSPTMEFTLLKDSWPAMDLLDGPSTPKASAMTEDNSVFSIWEENYQDLSGWCIDGFQGQCAFPIGEFETKKYSDMKSKDKGIAKRKTEAMGKSRELLGGQKNLTDSVPKESEFPAMGDTQTHLNEQLTIKSEIIDARSIEISDILPLAAIDSSPVNQGSDNWIQLANVDVPIIVSSPISVHQQNPTSESKNKFLTVEHTELIPEPITKNEEDDWDTINSFDNAESETFDLLSYLCDDNIQSPDGSVVSRDSGPTVTSESSATSRHVEGTPSVSRELRKPRKTVAGGVHYDEEASCSASSSIAAISAALESVANMPERAARNRHKRNSSAMENETRIARGRAKRRYVESDSEDRNSDGSYRDSREKNNEASRKSRQNKKAKEREMMLRASELERDNRILKMRVDELDKLVTSMRTAILKSALRRSS